MATVSEEDTSERNITTGILMPQLQHRFRVLYPKFNGFDEQACHALSMQTVHAHLDFKNKTVKLKIETPCQHAGVYLDAVNQLVSDLHVLTINLFDGNEHVTGTVMMTNCSVESHKANLDYAKSGILHHYIVVKYGALDFKT